MKTTTLKTLILYFCFFVTTEAQITPQFQTTIFVEDAIGNLDSVVVGFDTLATSGIDVEFGEIEILTPFDSIFEVRAASNFGISEKTSKVIIEKGLKLFPLSSSYGCYSSSTIFIYIKAKHQPVSISWNSNLLSDEICHNGSMLTNHWTDELAVPYDWDAHPQNKNYCMAAQDNFIIDISEEAILGEGVTSPVQVNKEVEGMGMQTIYGLRFFHAPAFSGYTPPCYYLTSTKEQNHKEEINVFPNPATDNVSFQLPEGVHISNLKLIDVSGKQLHVSYNRNTLNVTNYLNGVYFFQIIGSDGHHYNGKLIKT